MKNYQRLTERPIAGLRLIKERMKRPPEGYRAISGPESVRRAAPLVHEIEETRIRSILRFMKKIGLVTNHKSKRDGKARWNLTNRVRKLWAEVVEG